ncbi:hypothetical protein K8B33_03715 [Alcanivorax sp. JB21]|uniref:hypothetical protein n=1 Tax=Alcanivorax limicola TaxID=2874102 RepID=UPI001CC0100B|nr:hypothetical protein [Alcanivorax limicola]MBZ2188188.1 hypothetical protein [Alcanivorax limicola]
MPDVAVPWFRARTSQGVSNRICIACIEPEAAPDNVARWYTVSHQEVDGIGAMQRLCREFGIKVINSPAPRETVIPGFFRLLRQRQRQPTEPVLLPRWRAPTVTGAQAGDDGDRLPPAVSSALFTTAQTLALTVHAQERGVSLATLVFWALHRMVMSELAEGEGGRWLYPVNLRGALNLGDDERNHVGGFYLPLRRDVTPEQIQRTLRQRLRRADHWWMWHQARYACWLGQPLINRLYRNILTRPGHLGSFSSLGEWQLDFQGSRLPPGTRIAPCGPGSPNHPVANGVLVCNGELIMSLRLDPVLGRSDAERDACMARWRDELLSLLAPSGGTVVPDSGVLEPGVAESVR